MYFDSNPDLQRQLVADRQEHLRRAAGRSRLRREIRRDRGRRERVGSGRFRRF
jgi:hypothetical protein